MTKYEIRDPIHTRIPFNEMERDIIDHPFVQRLRFVSQLSFLQSYVYPGGVHDRFSHALGAMHVAGRLFGRVLASSQSFSSRFTAEELSSLQTRMRFAGLLHDIGHGPFSHSSECAFPNLLELSLDKTWWNKIPDRQAKHEDYSVLLIQTMVEEGVFDNDLGQDIASLIHDGIKPSQTFEAMNAKAPTLQKVLKSLVSGIVDCDRMDYLLRDSYFCGVTYGHFDIDWLISSLGIAEENGSFILTLSENGVRAFEDMLLARYHMIDQVYFHKTKAGFTYYLEEAIKSKEIDLHISANPYKYVALRDASVIESLFQSAQNPQNYWSYHLMRRIAPKRILRFHDNKEGDSDNLEQLKKVCEKHNIDWFVHSVAGELSRIEDVVKPGSIHVAKQTLRGTKFIPITEYSDLLQKYNEKIRFTDFYVLREDYDRFSSIISTIDLN